ncbi:MAG: hypothetical protein HS116_22580 [Planctomycetes bacterium]|nr:hypothetical protein [Planctomycetota bacterium]
MHDAHGTSTSPLPDAPPEPIPDSPIKSLWWFTLPLASVVILQLAGRQVILAGLSWQAHESGLAPEFDLAAFVVAMALMFVACAPLEGMGMVGLAYGDSAPVRRRIIGFAAAMSALSTLFVFLLGYTAAGAWTISNVQGLDAALTERVQFALKPLVCYPVVMCAMMLTSGWMKRCARGMVLAVANVVGLVSTGVLVVLLPQLGLDPLLGGMLAYIGGQALRTGMLCFSYAKSLAPATDRDPPPPLWREMGTFYLPLAWNGAFMLASRPMIQWFLAREERPEVVLAGFGIAFSVSQVFYGWLNDLRSHATAFREQPRVLAHLPHFATLLCAGITALMALLFWTPLSGTILQALMGLEGAVLEEARDGLSVMVFCPLAVTLRAYYQGLAVLHKRTVSYFTSSVARIVGIVALMLLSPWAGIHGAVLGTGGLIGGFLAESIVLAWSLHGHVPSLRMEAAPAKS